MTTIPYLKQYDDPITDYLKQYNKLLKQAYPNINELKNFLETNQHHEQTFGIKALELKYHAITTVPTTIEKTMSPYQLYESNNPLWTVELSANKIERFVNLEKYNGKLSKILFDSYYNNAKQGLCFDDNVDFDLLYPDSITNLKKGI